jgi:hypothetical protein
MLMYIYAHMLGGMHVPLMYIHAYMLKCIHAHMVLCIHICSHGYVSDMILFMYWHVLICIALT